MARRFQHLLVIAGLLGAGMAALVFQVVMSQWLTRFLGGDHLATGVTLAVFLAGLALGYALCGRWTRHVRRHFLVYAVLELSIGLWALAVPALSSGLERWTASWSFAYPYGLLLHGIAVASLLTLPATVLMGATVPFLTRGLARSRATVSRTHALAYGVNTAGAALGALVAGFHWVPAYGLTASLQRMALLNFVVALLFLAVGVRRDADPDETAAGGEPWAPSRLSAARVYTIGALNGVAVLLFETVTIRHCKLVFGSSSYTFAMVVTVFVLALALGSLAVALLPAAKPGRLWRVQCAAAVGLLLLWPTLDLWPYGAHLLRIGFQGGAVGFAFFHAAVFAALMLLLGVPVALLGATLPLLFHELRSDVERSGMLSGRLLAFNGLGTLIGSLAGSYLLFDLLDIPGVWLLVPLLAASNSLLAREPQLPARAFSPALVGIALLAWTVQPFHHPDRSAIGTFRLRTPAPFSFDGPTAFARHMLPKSKILARDDDPAGTVAVVETQREEGVVSRSLFVNGRSESDTVKDAITLLLSAHLPALFAPSRSRVLVVGVGTGLTLGQLALYDDVDDVVVAEISPAAVRFLPLFGEATGDVHLDPRLHMRIGDAQLVLRGEHEPFDIVISEPSNPWVTGVGQLFTDEFYHAVAQHLTDDGVFLQWVQLYETDFYSLALVLNTMKKTFPVLHAFRGSSRDLLVLAARRPFAAKDAARARESLAQAAGVRAALAERGIEGYADIVEREVQTLPVVLMRGEKFGIHVMDHPRLHYRAGRAMFAGASVTDEMLRYGPVELPLN